ncbi:hypothetical protein [Candidatus Uabimicrobium amorphum]|uniref:Uncharacterized protein n=1 Tax=Uabimicrobium amorphum TaxID=2596890 RepID=A0A5S9IS95_UABAM|nr:hypothetical protein [Candidatus Uabimicrobium amorphum]BBM86220.1 hypothetical protein UABAM_04606 [Candidatus Uabimicrobium amorphum]
MQKALQYVLLICMCFIYADNEPTGVITNGNEITFFYAKNSDAVGKTDKVVGNASRRQLEKEVLLHVANDLFDGDIAKTLDSKEFHTVRKKIYERGENYSKAAARAYAAEALQNQYVEEYKRLEKYRKLTSYSNTTGVVIETLATFASELTSLKKNPKIRKAITSGKITPAVLKLLQPTLARKITSSENRLNILRGKRDAHNKMLDKMFLEEESRQQEHLLLEKVRRERQQDLQSFRNEIDKKINSLPYLKQKEIVDLVNRLMEQREQKNQQQQQELEKKLKKELGDEFNKQISEMEKKIFSQLNRQKKASIQQQAKENIFQDTMRNIEDARAGIYFLASISKLVFKDDTPQIISTIGNSYLDIAQSVAEIDFSDFASLTTMVATGNIINASLAIISILNKTQKPNFEQIISEQLQKINENIANLSYEMHQRFDNVDYKLREIYYVTSQNHRILQDVLADVQAIQQKVENINVNILKIENSLIELEESIVQKISNQMQKNMEREAQVAFTDLIKEFKIDLKEEDRVIMSDNMKDKFVYALSKYQALATEHSKNIFQQDIPYAEFYSSYKDIRDKNETANYTLWENILSQTTDRHFSHFIYLFSGAQTTQNKYANPSSWVYAGNNFARFVAKYPDTYLQRETSAGRINDILRSGWHIQDGISSISKVNILKDNIKAYRNALAQVREEINRQIDHYNNTQFFAFHLWQGIYETTEMPFIPNKLMFNGKEYRISTTQMMSLPSYYKKAFALGYDLKFTASAKWSNTRKENILKQQRKVIKGGLFENDKIDLRSVKTGEKYFGVLDIDVNVILTQNGREVLHTFSTKTTEEKHYGGENNKKPYSAISEEQEFIASWPEIEKKIAYNLQLSEFIDHPEADTIISSNKEVKGSLSYANTNVHGDSLITVGDSFSGNFSHLRSKLTLKAGNQITILPQTQFDFRNGDVHLTIHKNPAALMISETLKERRKVILYGDNKVIHLPQPVGKPDMVDIKSVKVADQGILQSEQVKNNLRRLTIMRGVLKKYAEITMPASLSMGSLSNFFKKQNPSRLPKAQEVQELFDIHKEKLLNTDTHKIFDRVIWDPINKKIDLFEKQATNIMQSIENQTTKESRIDIQDVVEQLMTIKSVHHIHQVAKE